MNEIKISIPYSMFARIMQQYVIDMFYFSNSPEMLTVIEDIQTYWTLFDSDLRNLIETAARRRAERSPEVINPLLAFIEQQRHAQPKPQTPQPAVPYVELPVVNPARDKAHTTA